MKYLLEDESTTLWALRTWPLQTREMSTYWPVLRYSLRAENTVFLCSASKQLMMSLVEWTISQSLKMLVTTAV